MIVPMTKYYFVLYHGRHKEFLERLREEGLVDITATGWEPSEEERALLSVLDRHRTSGVRLKEIRNRGEYNGAEPFSSAGEAYDNYVEATSEIDRMNDLLQKTEKDAGQLGIWGDFSMERIRALAGSGIVLRYFSAPAKDFLDNLEQWDRQYTIVPVGESDGATYFVAVTEPGREIPINAQELKAPAASYSEKRAEAEEIKKQIGRQETILARVAASEELMKEHERQAGEALRYRRVFNSGRSEADGSLIVLQGWATRESSEQVDAMVDSHPEVIYLKSNPSPEDDTPVLLRNNRFARLFEFIGGFYSLPRYGSTDLTPYFAPFYMIFFGFCLAEGGYGLVIMLLGLSLLLRAKGNRSVSQAGMLTLLCGFSGMAFGLMAGSFFGVQLGETQAFKGLRDHFLTPDHLFPLALGLGVFQLLFALVIRIFSTARHFGFKYALSTTGWTVVLCSALCAMLLPDMGIDFSFRSPAFLILAAAGLFLMLFMNSPGKNPIVNLGNGLWNTYNDVTGFVGDFLSYIRLFAIGLSGGILALVFNDLAFGLSPDIPVVRQISIVLILLIGHGINMFMSTLSSFVHPLRLTFVEFYKNAGFESGQRAFTPFRKETTK